MAKGKKTGGRVKGTPNKATVEKAIIAEQIVTRAEMVGRKLAKEVLDEFMHLFASMAMAEKAQTVATVAVGSVARMPDLAQFEKWARLAVQCAKDLASYQSPTFRAIAVTSDVIDKGGAVRFVVENAPVLQIDAVANEQTSA